MYVFPGIGLGSILSKATTVTQSMIYASATSLSTSLNEQEIAQGWLYPDIARVREASVVVAMGVIRAAEEAGVAREPRTQTMDDGQLEQFVRAHMYDPHLETQKLEDHMRGEIEQVLKEINGDQPPLFASSNVQPVVEKAHLWMKGQL